MINWRFVPFIVQSSGRIIISVNLGGNADSSVPCYCMGLKDFFIALKTFLNPIQDKAIDTIKNNMDKFKEENHVRY